MKTYKDIMKTQSQLENEGYSIEESMFVNLELVITSTAPYTSSLEMNFPLCTLFSSYDIGVFLPDVLKTIVCVLDIPLNGSSVFEFQSLPCRIVCDASGSKILGFGHIEKDQFVLESDVMNMAFKNFKEKYKRDVK